MKSCSYPDCEEEESIPFKCRLCNQIFCAKHRLPEQHDCPRIGVYQTDEYKRAKISQKQKQEAKSESKSRKSKSKEPSKQFYTARDIEMKSRYLEQKDKFLLRSPLFSLYSFKFNWINILLASLYFIIIISLSTLFQLTVINNISIEIWPSVLLFLIIGYIIAIALIYSGHMIIEVLFAKKIGIRATISLWIQGMIIGIVGIFLPFLMTPNFLIFSEYGSGTKERGRVAFSGILWMFFWQLISLVIIILNIAGVSITWNYFYLGLESLNLFFYIYIIFHLIPFGFNHGRYIRSWNNKLFWSLLGSSIVMLLTYMILVTV